MLHASYSQNTIFRQTIRQIGTANSPGSGVAFKITPWSGGGYSQSGSNDKWNCNEQSLYPNHVCLLECMRINYKAVAPIVN